MDLNKFPHLKLVELGILLRNLNFIYWNGKLHFEKHPNPDGVDPSATGGSTSALNDQYVANFSCTFSD